MKGKCPYYKGLTIHLLKRVASLLSRPINMFIRKGSVLVIEAGYYIYKEVSVLAIGAGHSIF